MDQKVTDFQYMVVRSKRRTLSVEIQHSGAVVVRAPLREPESAITSFILSRQQWIARRLHVLHAAHDTLPKLTHPKSFYHRGSERVWEGAIAMRDRWEREQSLLVFNELLTDILPGLGVHALRFKRLAVRRMRRRWGSCSADGTVLLNTRLIRVPDRCSKAVIAHELAHLVYMNHGRQFKHLVSSLYPEYVQADKDLQAWAVVLE